MLNPYSFVRTFLQIRQIRKLLRGCDYQLAAKVLNNFFKDKVIPKELTKVLDKYLDKPCFDTALDIVKFDHNLGRFFYESKPGGMFYRQLKENSL